MKKGIVALLLVLVLIIIVSPGIIGRLAEKTVDENIEWAQQESQDISVTSQRFDRGWFSSEGQHRIEITSEDMRRSLLAEFGNELGGDLPVLVIDTRLDHGIIPVTSMTRDKGSLAPGLGSAISTMSLEMPDGDIVEVPGTIYSKVGLGGELDSNFVLDAGSFASDDTTAYWGNTDIRVVMSPTSNIAKLEGSIESLRITGADEDVEFGGLSFSGDQQPTRFGFALGNMQLEIQSISATTAAAPATAFGPFVVDARTAIVDDRITADTRFSLAGLEMPGVGEMGIEMDIGLSELEPEALAAIADAIDSLGPDEQDPQVLFAAAQAPLQDLLASGMKLDIRQLDIAVPQGIIKANLFATIQETDPADFVWTSLMLSTEGRASLVVPVAYMDFLTAMNPQAGAAVGMGFLKQNGDVYELQAEYKKGLLTVNGAPMPLPIPGQ